MVAWFLIGGDLYTAYTFVAMPALAYGAGAVAFFVIPYTVSSIRCSSSLFRACGRSATTTATSPRRISCAAGFGNRWLALAVTLSGIVATMPYIALQLVGLQVIIGGMGILGNRPWSSDIPLIIAFIILAAFTYTSGLRAPASIAIVKDVLIYITAFAAIIVIPIELGGFGKIFAAIPETQSCCSPRRRRTAPAPTVPMPPSRSARRWRCSSIRIR